MVGTGFSHVKDGTGYEQIAIETGQLRTNSYGNRPVDLSFLHKWLLVQTDHLNLSMGHGLDSTAIEVCVMLRFYLSVLVRAMSAGWSQLKKVLVVSDGQDQSSFEHHPSIHPDFSQKRLMNPVICRESRDWKINEPTLNCPYWND